MSVPDRPDDTQALLDYAQRLLAQVFGPDDQVNLVVIHRQPFRLVITSDHGARLTADALPGVN